MAAEHPAERSVRGPRHGTCPPLAASAGHDAIVSFRSSQEWACPPGMRVPHGPGNGWSPASLAEIHELSAVQLRDALRSGELSARAGHRSFPGPHRSPEPAPRGLHHRHCGPGAEGRRGSGPAPRPPEPERRRLAPAAWNAGRLQGPDGCGRGRHHAWKRRPGAQAGAGRRRASRRAQGCGGHLAGQDTGPGVRPDGLQREPDRPAVAQSACAQPQFGRLLGRQRCRRGRGAVAVRPRVRRRRLRADPGRGVRAGRAEARTWARAGRGKLRRSRPARGCRTARPLRRRCRAAARCPGAAARGPTGCGPTKCGRTGRGRPGARQLPRTDRQGAAPAADRHKPRQPVANDVPLHPGP